MELALKGHRRQRSNRKLKLGWRRPSLDLEKVVRADGLRKEHGQRAHSLGKACLTDRVLNSFIL